MMEFNWQDFDKNYSDLDPALIAGVVDWFAEKYSIQFHPIESPLAEIMDDFVPGILEDLQTQRREVLISAAQERLDIFPEGLGLIHDNDAIYPYYQISEPATDHITGLESIWQASLGLLISPMEQSFAIKVETIRVYSAYAGARYRTSLEIVDKYSEVNRVEIAFYEQTENPGQAATIAEGSDDRLAQLCMHYALKIEDLDLLNACEHINSRRNGVLGSVLRRMGMK